MYKEGQVVVGSTISLKGELCLTGEPECFFKEVIFQLSPGGRIRAQEEEKEWWGRWERQLVVEQSTQRGPEKKTLV